MRKFDTSLLCNLLTDLSNSLIRAKNPAHKYIDLLIDELTKKNPTVKHRELLQQIKSSAKMVEYANFTSQQEALWMKIWTEATQLLNKMKS